MAQPAYSEDLDFSQVVGKMHTERFHRVTNSPWYRDAEYFRFSDAEYERRYTATREKMRRLGLDVLIASGGPNHWSWGSGMRWLSNYWEWHGVTAYVVVGLEGDPVLVVGPGGSHREAIRRLTPIEDVRESHWGRSAEVMVELIRSWGVDRATVGISAIDPIYDHYLPVNEYRVLEEGLPGADLRLVGDFFHELVHVKSPEEMDAVRKAGTIMDRAMHAMVAAARPGVTEYQLAAAVTGAVMEAGGQIDFTIIGSTPMDDPAMVFGNPWPSGRVLEEGDMIHNEIACGFAGFSVQIGTPICIGSPPARVREFFDDIVLPGYKLQEAELRPGKTWKDVSRAGSFYFDRGYDSRPLYLHCLDFVSHPPHATFEGMRGEETDLEIVPGIATMLEPTTITPDGRLGIFLGRSYLITDDGHERVTRFPLELVVV
ncbi:MAG: M24 family metallopeptidase [Acidimicrobiia bacterium]